MLDASSELLPRHAKLAEVPFFAQEDYQCGPAALAMSLDAAGIKTTPEALVPEVYLPGRQGSLQVEMLAASRRHGVIAYQLAPDLRDLVAEVAAGTPVIVLQNLALSWYPVWHYAVVIGYNLDRAEIILRSGRERLQVLPMTTFEHTWRRGGYWAMVALPPGKIPGSAEENSFVSAVSAFEKIGYPERAQITYLAALKRWPGNLVAQIGIGNTAYRMKDLAQAEAAFRLAIQDHPDAVAALNNLAQVLADLGRDEEALSFARRAVALGGPLRDIAQATLSDIERRLRQ
ncbi:MAG: PA2778 family cysteine peptidase [Sideroxyarcus sp.]|nr:PA2778 family cysteine peptidase [Sideroxyarcus sp.]